MDGFLTRIALRLRINQAVTASSTKIFVAAWLLADATAVGGTELEPEPVESFLFPLYTLDGEASINSQGLTDILVPIDYHFGRTDYWFGGQRYYFEIRLVDESDDENLEPLSAPTWVAFAAPRSASDTNDALLLHLTGDPTLDGSAAYTMMGTGYPFDAGTGTHDPIKGPGDSPQSISNRWLGIRVRISPVGIKPQPPSGLTTRPAPPAAPPGD